MTGLRVLVLGVGDAFSALHRSTCLALEAEERSGTRALPARRRLVILLV